MFLQVSESAGGVCDDATFMLVPLSQSADEYLALWNRTGPNADPSPSAPWAVYQRHRRPFTGEQAWSTTALTPQNTGVGVHFDVPKGDGAWFVSAGGGRCDLLPSAGDIEGVARAWALTYKREVSGAITVSGSSAPAPGVNVEANCNGGGMTATDGQGHYALLVDKGPCTVTPRLINGLKATPESRSFDVESNVSGVDFQVPCGAVPEPSSTATNGPRRPDAALIPDVSSADCLQVFIKIVGPIPNVGTRSGLSVDNYVPSDGPMNFTELTGAPHERPPPWSRSIRWASSACPGAPTSS